MGKLLLGLLLLATSCLSAQSTFTSIEQAKYSHGDTLKYISGSRYKIEIGFHVKDGYIVLKNKDLNTESTFINVLPGNKPNTWRALLKGTGQTYLFSFITNEDGMCLVMDDSIITYFLKVHSASLNK